MRSVIHLAIITTLFFSACSTKSSTTKLDELKKMAATETFPDDTYLDTTSNKKALIILAHDDDDCAMAGTIAKLKAAGWKIKQVSLTIHEARNRGAHPATIICDGNEPLLPDGIYRMGLNTMKNAYIPISKDEMEKQFLREKITAAVKKKVDSFQPNVIFTLDNEMGGYGHPEHIFISQLVVDLFKSKDINVNRIYQSVFTDHMEKEIVEVWLGDKMKNSGYPDPTAMAKQLYGLDKGMPEPTTQINIKSSGDKKMKYLMAYKEDVRKNLRKFIPYFEDFDAATYFSIFDREFFRVIE